MLNPYEAHHVREMLLVSPGRLARKMDTTAEQARALQHYLVLVFVAAYRRDHGGDVVTPSLRADAKLKSLEPRIRQVVRDALTSVSYAMPTPSMAAVGR